MLQGLILLGSLTLMWAESEWSPRDRCGRSLSGHLAIVRELCIRGANVNAARPDIGLISLILASQNGYLEIVRELCFRGCESTAARPEWRPAGHGRPARPADHRQLFSKLLNVLLIVH